MIVVMAIGLYTVRAILDLLGVVDYGIYNVVGGVVSMFSFLNGTLATSSQRYFSIELAKGDKKRLKQWVCLNITTFSIFILIFLVIAETIGLWFVNYKMTIPAERLFAANVVYQLSIVTFCIHFFNVPYNALIIAHERMSAFAYISIIEAASKLVIVFLLSISTWDKLIVYGFLMFIVSCGITSSYIIYSLHYFEEAKYRPYWNTAEMKELLSFSGWHFFGTFSVVVRSQGINILLNLFFNPAINAARAVAFQISHSVNQLSHNFFVAVKPQIYKSYAAGDFEGLYKLINRSTIMCSFLVSILIYPVLANTQYVLGIWLHKVPEYAVIFTQLVLINALIDSTNGPTIAPALATGKIRKYQEVVAMLIFMNLPISYIALKLGAEPTVTMQVSIVLSLVTAIARAYMLRSMIGFPFGRYVVLFAKLIVASVGILVVIYYFMHNVANSFMSLIMYSIAVDTIVVLVYLGIVFDKDDVRYLFKFVKNKIVKKVNEKIE
jgi:O-antigen/teichoic acid export membrane protein